ncbi:hypothetical protein HYPSUDRAFT_208830 [Hypholoma sublateritium FD-334 SS-4]|uniref:Uncharacterized protein n=1 Tax=Hypholoma sublateritium (strain FD-334 SS-4) TaxID=945553 RepID=A0A0D2P0W3_HYPSF|nr:hypothetical protein HYPSUDRAFT_208830 [Hypholoma sublateritium FD-334 SS-4]
MPEQRYILRDNGVWRLVRMRQPVWDRLEVLMGMYYQDAREELLEAAGGERHGEHERRALGDPFDVASPTNLVWAIGDRPVNPLGRRMAWVDQLHFAEEAAGMFALPVFGAQPGDLGAVVDMNEPEEMDSSEEEDGEVEEEGGVGEEHGGPGQSAGRAILVDGSEDGEIVEDAADGQMLE